MTRSVPARDSIAGRRDAEHSPGAPPLYLFLSDPGRAAAELGLFFASRPLRPVLPRGDGHPVLVLPGLLADDNSTRPLRGVLRHLGYQVHGWRLGRNIGPTSRAVDGLAARVAQLDDRHGCPISVIGWSLGGIFAREIARRSPEQVRQVITLGSPFRLTHSSQTRAHRAFERFSHLHVEQIRFPLEHDVPELPVPTTSVYSVLDGIVSWRSCLNPPGPRAENVAVVGSHCGLGHNPTAIWVIADRLAQPAGQWQPFRPPAALMAAYRPPRAAQRYSAA